MKKILFILLFILVLLKTIIFVNQERIMHPEKRLLQAYHYEWLDYPLEHGLKIEKYISEKKTPYLIVRQDMSNGLSKRQKLLTKQLGEYKVKKDAGVLVLLHGKNGRKEDLLPVAERYVALGFTCLLLDLPHHGESERKHLYYTNKVYEKFYVDEVLEDFSKHISIEDKALYMWGMSLGGAFAISNVLNSKHTFKGMVLVSTFDRFDSVLKRKSQAIFGDALGTLLYRGLEKSLVLFYDFNPSSVNSANIAKELKLPVYMVHGKKDALIAYTQGEKLFNSFTSTQKKLYLDEEGDHHNILVTKHKFYKESGLFLLGERR